uniref:Uncharacterized protein n=1 Tax=Globisporangium ultimum (strain ATCC 200006 / CBS 805.95 / DAOM BR144) TaxID=431595 RepID=K3WZU8_GLOUD
SRLDRCALFTNRGKQLTAQQLLAPVGIQVNLKFCSLRIIFNVVNKLKLSDVDKERVRDFVFKLQAAISKSEYEAVLAEIRNSFTVPINQGTQREEYVDDYLRAIHLTSWTVYGNCEHPAADLDFFRTSWSCMSPCGHPSPLYGVRTTSVIESKRNTLVWNCARDKLQPNVIVPFCVKA